MPYYQDVLHGEVARWKSYALAEAFGCRPLVWIDDMCLLYEASWPARNEMPTLVVPVDPQYGLTDEHMAAVDTFVAEHSVGRL